MANFEHTVKTTPPLTSVGGTLALNAGGAATQLTATSTKCDYIWFGAPMDAAGVATNTKVVLIGDSAGQNMPIAVNNFEGLYYPTNDASKVWCKLAAAAAAQTLPYRIFA